MSDQEKFVSWLEGYLEAMERAINNKISSEDLISAIKKKMKEAKEDITTTDKIVLHD